MNRRSLIQSLLAGSGLPVLPLIGEATPITLQATGAKIVTPSAAEVTAVCNGAVLNDLQVDVEIRLRQTGRPLQKVTFTARKMSITNVSRDYDYTEHGDQLRRLAYIQETEIQLIAGPMQVKTLPDLLVS